MWAGDNAANYCTSMLAALERVVAVLLLPSGHSNIGAAAAKARWASAARSPCCSKAGTLYFKLDVPPKDAQPGWSPMARPFIESGGCPVL